ncbi:zinc ABC transporter substrate-binding protein [Nocardioides guangzhouensis]|uniref:Zinc ABC transporter substrate-binding protein n=1 Tax=Nocardioides guangzhouensis TaxID=2497878 RepID=A0A4Q4ZE17_9ACTN|nr:metal ABC transporter substrate-binding protein [Nocardioides guangzhouensis]RYP85895.1 zinc ABC transporter substrate-binding protein [Nocardioides guangzhouensis]
MSTSLRARLALVPAAAVLLGGCSALTSEPADDHTVVAAFYPLAWVAERVAGNGFDVVNLTQPGSEPHDLELSIRETAAVEDAGLVIHEQGFQPAVDAAIEQNAQGAVLDVTDVVDLRPFAEHDHEDGHTDDHTDEHTDEEHSADDGHDHGDLDPHFWLDPLLLADVGDAVADELAGLDPGRADQVRANAADLRADLERLDREYAAGLADCERDTVVVNHDAFGYLAHYGLHIEPVVGLSPDAEPTPADLARLHDLVEAEGITTVFAETLVSRKTVDTLAGDLGVEVAVLDPIEGLSDQTADEDYLSLMRRNLRELERANGCR